MKSIWKSAVKSQFCFLYIVSFYGQIVFSQTLTVSNQEFLNCRESNLTHITMYTTLKKMSKVNFTYHIECTSVIDMKRHWFECQSWDNQRNLDQVEVECGVPHILYPFTSIALFKEGNTKTTGNNSKQLVVKNQNILNEKCSRMHGVRHMRLHTQLKNNLIEIDVKLYNWDLLFIDKLYAFTNRSTDFINRHGVEVNYLTTERTLNQTIRLRDSKINHICQVCVTVMFALDIVHTNQKYTKCQEKQCEKPPKINVPQTSSMKIKPIFPVLVISIVVFIIIILVYKIKGSRYCIQRQPNRQLQQRPQQIAVVDIGLLIASQDPSVDDNKPALPMYVYKLEDNYTPLELIER